MGRTVWLHGEWIGDLSQDNAKMSRFTWSETEGRAAEGV
jgi:hypothetical protein